ncbi:hypothetical protein C8R45DRAFT_1171312 [Mycena sanguinolenta]|nr:hypothetical protein C8R45DRAFT_1171312 [Mycena sanguinolenta]
MYHGWSCMAMDCHAWSCVAMHGQAWPYMATGLLSNKARHTIPLPTGWMALSAKELKPWGGAFDDERWSQLQRTATQCQTSGYSVVQHSRRDVPNPMRGPAEGEKIRFRRGTAEYSVIVPYMLEPPQSSAVGIAADRAAINAAISTAGSRHSRAGFDLIKRLRSFLPAPAEKGLAVSLLIVSSLLFFTSQHASTLRSYGSCPFFDAERQAAELKSSRQVSVGIHLWRASADIEFCKTQWECADSIFVVALEETGARQELEWPAADAVDGLRVFVWRNAAISAADHATDPINHNSRMLSEPQHIQSNSTGT